MLKRLTIATRGSRLALWQAGWVKEALNRLQPGLAIELLVLKTRGDLILDRPLAKVGGKGLFVKEIEEALLDGRADLAVHSMKDVPMQLPTGLTLGVIPKRGPVEDLLVCSTYRSLGDLPRGARVGTSSLRRQAQLLAKRPDLKILNLRGNVDTRLGKLLAGQYEAIVMAAAAVARLGLDQPGTASGATLGVIPGATNADAAKPGTQNWPGHVIMNPEYFLPAAGQGALGLEYRQNRADLEQLLAPLEHAPSRACVLAERAFLAALEGNCQTPIAALAHLGEYAGPEATKLRLEGLVADEQGKRVIRRVMEGSFDKPLELGQNLAELIKEAGAAEILAKVSD